MVLARFLFQMKEPMQEIMPEDKMPSVKVQGMHCGNCKKAVEAAVGKVPGVKSVAVSLEKGEAVWMDEEGKPAAREAIVEAIEDIGFEAE